MMLLASSVELITIYISLELTALPVAALAAFLRRQPFCRVRSEILVLSGVSSALLLYGLVMVYGFTGSTQLDEIASGWAAWPLSPVEPFGGYALLFGIVLIIAGFGFKIAAVPFQMWAPDVYQGAPTPITAFLSVASKAAGFAVVLRVFYIAFPMDSLIVEWSSIFAILAALSMSLGNLIAIPSTEHQAHAGLQHDRPRRIPHVRPGCSRGARLGRRRHHRASASSSTLPGMRLPTWPPSPP